MGNVSTDPLRALRLARDQGYVGLLVEQGVPLLDRDLNLLGDLVASTVREVLAHHLGDGVADGGDAFAIEAVEAANDVRIGGPGACLVAGIEVAIGAPLHYGAQDGVAPLSTPALDRDDLVYLDVWVEEVDASADSALANGDDVALQTSVRLRPAWRVRTAEGARAAPAPAAGHAHCPLARLERVRGAPAIAPEMIVDLRRTGLNLAEIARRLDRVEAALHGRPEPERAPRALVEGRSA
jgi:hypothetical protein